MADEQEKVTLTRRDALKALGAGVAALGLTNLGTAYATSRWSEEQSGPELQDLRAEVEKLRGLVQLYETLEKIGIDTVISGALTVFKGFLDPLRGGVGLLRSGVTAVDTALGGFRSTFAAFRDALAAAEGAVTGISNRLKDAQNWLDQTTKPVQSPLQRLREFFDDLLSKIPFGVGDNIKKTLDALVNLVGSLPDAILVVNVRLLDPLRAGWFSDDNSKNLQGTLIDPITSKVLDPLQGFLGEVETAIAHWETDVATPVGDALTSRADVRGQIADYRQKNGMQ